MNVLRLSALSLFVALAAGPLGGCNLTYDRESVKFDDASALTCPTAAQPGAVNKCGTGAGAYCTNFNFDPANCGSCGHACTGGQSCNSGVCGASAGCLPPTPNQCGTPPTAYCTNVLSDSFNCGTCNNICTGGQTCGGGGIPGVCGSAGTCSGATPDSCPGGTGTVCTNRLSDAQNCGTCGNICASNVCVSGTCGAPTSSTLVFDSSVSGTIGSATDKDFYLFTVGPSGLEIRFQTFDAGGVACSNVDTHVWVYDTAMTQLATNDDTGIGSCEDFAITLTAGTYYVAVGWHSLYATPFNYVLRNTTAPPGGSTRTLSCNRTTSGWCDEQSGVMTLANVATFESDCAWVGGAYTQAACPTTTLNGYCNSNTYPYIPSTPLHWVYYVGASYPDQAAAEGSCTTYAGTWVYGTSPGLTVTPLYPTNGANWNDWVEVVAGVPQDTACYGGVDCVHAGEVRRVDVTARSTCANLTATDALGAFDWVCDNAPGHARFTSTGLKAGKRLADLIDATGAAPAWRTNSVTVLDGGVSLGSSTPAAWWANLFEWLPSGGTMSNPGRIYVAEATSPLTTYYVAAAHVALVVPPGLFLQAPGNADVVNASSQDYLWLEGEFRQTTTTAAANILKLEFVGHSVVRNVRMVGPNNATGTYGLWLKDSSRNRVEGLVATGVPTAVAVDGIGATYNQLSGLTLDTCDNTCVLVTNGGGRNDINVVNAYRGTYGVMVFSSNQNRVQGVNLEGFTHGLHLSTAQGNLVQDLTVAACRTYGIWLNNSARNALVGIRTSNHGNHGVYLMSSNENVLVDVLAVANPGDGLSLNYSNDNRIFAVTSSRNAGWGVWLNSSDGNLISSADATLNYGGFRFSGSIGTLFSDVAATDNFAQGLYADGASSTVLTGQVKVGGNNAGIGDCYADSISIGFGPQGYSGTCFASSPSGLNNELPTISSGISLLPPSPSAFVGAGIAGYVSDLDGTEIDWFSSAPWHSVWVRADGQLGALGCPAPATRTQAACGVGWIGSAVQFDWSLLASPDPFLFALGAPETPPVHVQGWSAPVWWSASSFFPRSYEILGDGSGNDDGVCDLGTGEHCVVMRNIGAYQGHGAWSSYPSGGATFWFQGANGY